MKGFKDFMNEQSIKERKYVCVIYTQETQTKLRKWCEENGFDLTTSFSGKKQAAEDFDFHTTIFYSTNEIELENTKKKIGPHPVTPVGFKLLGEENNIPVLIVKSSFITKIRNDYANYGLQDKWDEYIPHISLSYNYTGDLPKINLPDFRIDFDTIKVENIIE